MQIKKYNKYFYLFLLIIGLWNGYYFFYPPSNQMGAPPNVPSWVFAIKDILFTFLLIHGILILSKQKKLFKAQFVYFPFFIIYLLISLSHFPFTNAENIFFRIKDDIKNIFYYSLLVPISFYYLCTEEKIKKVIYTIIFIGNIVSIFGIINKIAFPDYTSSLGSVISTFGNGNNLAFFLSQNIAVLMGLLIFLNKKINFLLVMSLILHCVCLLMTLKFMSILNIVLVASFIVIIRKNKFLSILKFVSILIILFSLSIPTGIFENISAKLTAAITGYQSTTIIARIQSYNHYFNYVTNTSIINIFFGSYTEHDMYIRYDSLWLSILKNNGVIGLFLIVCPFVLISIKSLKNYKKLFNFDPEIGTIVLSLGVFITITIILDNNITSYLNKFPIMVYYYLGCSIIIYSILLSRNKTENYKLNIG